MIAPIHTGPRTLEREAPTLRDRETEEEDPSRDERQTQVRENIRQECRFALLACAAQQGSAMTMRDVKEYETAGLSEEALELAETEDRKTQWLLEQRRQLVPLFIRQAETAGIQALALINEAERQKWLLPSSAAKWRGRLKNENTPWLKKKQFIEETLPSYVRNWQKIAEDYRTVLQKEKDLKIAPEDRKHHPALAALHSKDFLGGKLSYNKRRNLVDAASAYVHAYTKDSGKKEGKTEGQDMRTLYAGAKRKLEALTKGRNRALAPWKVGTWLRRIFESSAKKELIEKFVNGSASDASVTLSKLIGNWTQVRGKFDALEKQRKEKGTPQSFHFVTENIFLGWDYEKRRAYVEEGQHRINALDISKEKYSFLLIRHALDAGDWDEAEHLIHDEKTNPWLSKEAKAKVQSMENFLRTHRTEKGTSAKEKTPTDEETVQEVRNLMEMIPVPYRQHHIKCLERGVGAFWCWKVLWYNLVWCKNRGYWNPRIQAQKKREADQFTQKREKDGHGGGFEANTLTGATNESAAVRDQREHVGPQWLFMGSDSSETIADKCYREQHNRNFWYWTSVIPQGVGYEDHQFVVQSVHPRMMKLAREMEKRGINYTQSGSVQYKNPAAKPAPVKKAPSVKYQDPTPVSKA